MVDRRALLSDLQRLLPKLDADLRIRASDTPPSTTASQTGPRRVLLIGMGSSERFSV